MKIPQKKENLTLRTRQAIHNELFKPLKYEISDYHYVQKGKLISTLKRFRVKPQVVTFCFNSADDGFRILNKEHIYIEFGGDFPNYSRFSKMIEVIKALHKHIATIQYVQLTEYQTLTSFAQYVFFSQLSDWLEVAHVYISNVTWDYDKPWKVPRSLLRDFPSNVTPILTTKQMKNKVKEHNLRIIQMVLAEIKQALGLVRMSKNQTFLIRFITPYLLV